MKVPQISIFMENRAGRLYAVAQLLGEAGINIRALTLADTSDFGILRLIVDKPDVAQEVLRANKFTFNVTDVIAIEIPDVPGGMAKVLGILQKADVNVEYMYAFVEKSGGKAVVIFRFDNVERVLGLLGTDGLTVLRAEDLLKM